MKRTAPLLLLLLLSGLFSGCAGAAHVKTKDIAAAQLAVLPVINETKDVEGPVLIRKLLERWLAQRGYMVVPDVIVDAELVNMGIKEPGEMPAAQLQEFARRTGVDTVAGADLLEFVASNSGYRQERRVAVTLRFLTARSGKVLWEATDREMNLGSTRDPVKAVYDYVKGWGMAAMEKAGNRPLFAESNKLIERLTSRLSFYSASR